LDRWLRFLNEAKILDADALPGELAAGPDIVQAVAELGRMLGRQMTRRFGSVSPTPHWNWGVSGGPYRP
jgi:hypothetical protein